MPALLTSSRELQANGRSDDDDVDRRFGIRGKSVSGRTGWAAYLRQVSRNGME